MRGTTEKQAPTLPVQWVYDEVIHNQKGDSDMTKEEAIEILKNGGWWDLLIPITTIEGRSDEDKLHQAIDMAISALRSAPQPGKPLTLEQLREMDGQPVWIEDVNRWGLVSIPEAGQFKNSPFVLFRKSGVQFEWLVEDSELTVCSYPPAHIDRSEWKPCVDCRIKCRTCVVRGKEKCARCEKYSEYVPENNFCSNCGRPLTEEAWAELEKCIGGKL